MASEQAQRVRPAPSRLQEESALKVTYSSAAPFSTDGAAVFYKGNNAVYLKAGLDGTPGDITGFISANCTDTTNYSVAQ